MYYLRTTRFDAWIVVLTAISAVAVSVEFCVLIGVFLSFVLYVPQAARVHHVTELVMTPERVVRERHATDVPCSRIRIFSLEGEFFFGAAPELEQHFEAIAATADEGARVIVLRLKRVRNPDAVCMSVLDRFIERMHDARRDRAAVRRAARFDESDRTPAAWPAGWGRSACSCFKRPASSGPARSKPCGSPTK